MKVVFQKTFATCGYCGYVWILRIEGLVPKMCPRCKKRFVNGEGAPGWANKRVELEDVTVDSYEELRRRLTKLNK